MPMMGLAAFFAAATAAGDYLSAVPIRGAEAAEKTHAPVATTIQPRVPQDTAVVMAANFEPGASGENVNLPVVAVTPPVREPFVFPALSAADLPLGWGLDPAPALSSFANLESARDDEWHAGTLAERDQAWRQWQWDNSPNFLHRGLDVAFGAPRAACDEACEVVRWWLTSSGTSSVRDDQDGPVVAKLIEFREPEPVRSHFREFAWEFVNSQDKVFGFAGDAFLFTYGFDNLDRYDAVLMDDIMEEEGKVVLDVLREVYLSKYFGSEDSLKGGRAWAVRNWTAVDWAICPPVLAGYTWLRGFERRLKFAGTRLRFKLDPIAKLYDALRDDDERLIGAFTAEWSVGSFPVKLLVSAGLDRGEPELDFVGIGTHVGIAKGMVRERFDWENRDLYVDED